MEASAPPHAEALSSSDTQPPAAPTREPGGVLPAPPAAAATAASAPAPVAAESTGAVGPTLASRREELMRLKLGELKMRARDLKVDAEALERAIDEADDPRAAAADMILGATATRDWVPEEGVPLFDSSSTPTDDVAPRGACDLDGLGFVAIVREQQPQLQVGPEPEPEPEVVRLESAAMPQVVKPQAARGRKTIVFGQPDDLGMVLGSDDPVDKMWREVGQTSSGASTDPGGEREWLELEEWHRKQRVQQKEPVYVEAAGVYAMKRGVAPGMKLVSVQGNEVGHLSLREVSAALAQAGRPLTLVFEHADATTAAAVKKLASVGKEEKKELKSAAKQKKKTTKAAAATVKKSAKEAKRQEDAASGKSGQLQGLAGVGGKVVAAVAAGPGRSAIAPSAGSTIIPTAAGSTDAPEHEVSGLMAAGGTEAGSPVTPTMR